MPIRLPIRLASSELEEAIKLSRGWTYWPRRILVEKHGYSFLWIAFCGLSAMLLHSKQYATRDIALGTMASAVVGFGFLTLIAARRRASLRRKLRNHNSEAGTALIDHEGVLFEYESGATLRIPWSFPRRAIVGRACAVLFGNRRLPFGARRLHILPLSALSKQERLGLMSILRVHLGPGKMKER